jgi:hypothetical protein
LVAAQQAFGIEAELWSVSDPNLLGRPLENPRVTVAAVLHKYLVAKMGADRFTMFRNAIGMMSSILELALDMIINRHWISGALSKEQISKIASRFEGVFWTLHDYPPLTGVPFSRRMQASPFGLSFMPHGAINYLALN